MIIHPCPNFGLYRPAAKTKQKQNKKQNKNEAKQRKQNTKQNMTLFIDSYE